MDVGGLTRTRSDSNSIHIDDSELEREVSLVLDNSEVGMSLFHSLYDDFM